MKGLIDCLVCDKDMWFGVNGIINLWCLLCDYRCTDDLGSHLDETVLAKLPDNYRSILKQSITSEEDDMGTRSSLNLFFLSV